MQSTFVGETSREHIIVPLSSKSRDVLKDLVKQWIVFGRSMDALSVVWWLSTHRTHHNSRLAVISNSGLHFLDLRAEYLMRGYNEEEIIILPSHTVCFVFPTQGQ